MTDAKMSYTLHNIYEKWIDLDGFDRTGEQCTAGGNESTVPRLVSVEWRRMYKADHWKSVGLMANPLS